MGPKRSARSTSRKVARQHHLNAQKTDRAKRPAELAHLAVVFGAKAAPLVVLRSFESADAGGRGCRSRLASRKRGQWRLGGNEARPLEPSAVAETAYIRLDRLVRRALAS